MEIVNVQQELIKDRIIFYPYDNYYKIYDSVVLTCYMTSKQDPQRGIFQENNSYEYIKPWYASMKEKNLHGIIFYDKLSEEFILKYQTNKIIFKKCTMGAYSINDERYIIYYQYLIKNPYKFVLMTDVSDVYVNKDPFVVIGDTKYNNKLFIGTNVVGIGAKKRTPMWFERRKWKIDPFNKKLSETKLDIIGYQPNQIQIYSAGLIGGSHSGVLKLISHIIKIMLIIKSEKNYNMIILNYIINKYLLDGYDDKTFCTNYIHTGAPFNSLFGKNEKLENSECCLIHK